ncbi:MAG: hypothetical protein ACYDDO_13690 [Acidiferrobacterales bacterium]
MYYPYKNNGKYIIDTTRAGSKSTAFRGVGPGLSHSFGKTGGTMGLTMVGGGKDRFCNLQNFMPVLDCGMTFTGQELFLNYGRWQPGSQPATVFTPSSGIEGDRVRQSQLQQMSVNKYPGRETPSLAPQRRRQ